MFPELMNHPERLMVVGGVFLLLGLAGCFSGMYLFFRLLEQPREWRQRAAERLRSRPFSARFAMGLTLAVIVLNLTLMAVTRIGQVLAPEMAARNVGWLLVLNGVCFHGFMLVAVLVYIRRRGVSWRRALDARRQGWLKSARQGVWWYLAMIPVVVVSGLVFHLLLRWLEVPVEPQSQLLLMARNFSWPIRIYLYSLVIFWGPVAEELYFRGVLLPVFARWWKPLPAVLFLGLVFALIHMHVPSLAVLFVVATVLSLAYIATGSIVTPIVIHMLFNSISLASFLYLVK